MDCDEGIVDQDLHLIGKVIESGRCIVLALNKVDMLSRIDRDNIKREIKRRLRFIDYAEVHFVSAKKGVGVQKLLNSVDKAYRSSIATFPTSKLTFILEGAIEEHQPPLVNG